MGSESTITVRIGTIMVLISFVSGIIGAGVSYAFAYGFNARDRQAQIETHEHFEHQIEDIRTTIRLNKAETMKYTDTEVGGLRADWERELNR